MNFLELRKSEVQLRRIPLLGTAVNNLLPTLCSHRVPTTHGTAKCLSSLHLSKKLESIVVLNTIAVCSEQMTPNPTNT